MPTKPKRFDCYSMNHPTTGCSEVGITTESGEQYTIEFDHKKGEARIRMKNSPNVHAVSMSTLAAAIIKSGKQRAVPPFGHREDLPYEQEYRKRRKRD